MARSLVLNASYEPLAVVSDRRALILILAEKATLVVARDQTWIAASLVAQVPSVVRLNRYVKVPYRRGVPVSRSSVFGRDGHRCQYCGGSAESIDHVIPRSKGGQHVWENVVACCRACNVRKGDRSPAESGMSLRSVPGQPRPFAWVYNSVGYQLDPNWRSFLAESA